MNDPIKEDLEKLEAEINTLLEPLHEVSIDMIQQEFTEFPIFVAHDGNVEIGEALFDRAEYSIPFTLSASSLEEFNDLGIIPDDKKELFRIAYGNPRQFLCIFFIKDDSARFIFYPIAKRNTDTNNDPD